MRKALWNAFYKWRFYELGQEQYDECMGKLFAGNLNSLQLANRVICIFAACFAFFPIAVERNLSKAGIYFIYTSIALLLTMLAGRRERQQNQGKTVSRRSIYALIIMYFINLMTFGVYLSVWSNPDKLAVTFMTFLICSLFLLITPPMFNLCLTICAMVLFAISSVLIKSPQKWIFDLANVLIAGSVGLFFSWQINRLRVIAELNANKLEEERNRYFSQSTVDELTQLRNRRDFMQTFKRYLDSFRSSDECLCVAIIDIDYFKDYNDHYGHPQGDECLRMIGNALSSLAESAGLYVSRVGGEEFAMLWFEQETGRANRILKKTHKNIRDLDIKHVKSRVAPHVTVSMGIHITRCGARSDVAALYKLADKSLYAAKRGGRNCTCVSGDRYNEPTIIPN